MLSSILTVASEMFGGEAWIIGIYGVPIVLVALIGGIILYRITGKRSDPHADLAKEISYTYVGEHVSGEDEEEFENPAMADSMPQPKVRRVPVQEREATLPRLQLFGTAQKDGERVAIFSTGRRVRSEGKIVSERRHGYYLVEKRGNHMWVAE